METERYNGNGIVIENLEIGERKFTPREPEPASLYEGPRCKRLPRDIIQRLYLIEGGQRVVLTDGNDYEVRELVLHGKPTGSLEVLGYGNRDDEIRYILPLGIKPDQPEDKSVASLVWATRLKISGKN